MAENTENIWPFDRVLFQEQIYYCHDLFRVDVLVHRHMWFVENFVAGCVVRVRVERHLVVAHLVQHDAQRENIRLAIVGRPNEHLRRLVGRIVGWACLLFVPDRARPLKIRDLNLAVLVKENFLGVEHAVNDALVAQVAQTVGNLDEVSPLLLFGHNLIIFPKIINPIHQTHFILLVDHVHLIVLLEIVNQMQDMLVVKVFHYYRLLPRQLYFIVLHMLKFDYLENVKFVIHSRSDYRLNTPGPASLDFCFDNNVLFAESRVRTWLICTLPHTKILNLITNQTKLFE